eukprot:6411471-Prymnesium_polylepis.1
MQIGSIHWANTSYFHTFGYFVNSTFGYFVDTCADNTSARCASTGELNLHERGFPQHPQPTQDASVPHQGVCYLKHRRDAELPGTRVSTRGAALQIGSVRARRERLGNAGGP